VKNYFNQATLQYLQGIEDWGAMATPMACGYLFSYDNFFNMLAENRGLLLFFFFSLRHHWIL